MRGTRVRQRARGRTRIRFRKSPKCLEDGPTGNKCSMSAAGLLAIAVEMPSPWLTCRLRCKGKQRSLLQQEARRDEILQKLHERTALHNFSFCGDCITIQGPLKANKLHFHEMICSLAAALYHAEVFQLGERSIEHSPAIEVSKSHCRIIVIIEDQTHILSSALLPSSSTLSPSSEEMIASKAVHRSAILTMTPDSR